MATTVSAPPATPQSDLVRAEPGPAWGRLPLQARPSDPADGPAQQPAPRTVAGVDGDVRAGHGQVEGDVSIAPRVWVSCAHGENGAACRRVLRQRHLREKEGPVSTGCPMQAPVTPCLEPAGLGEGLGLARAAIARVAQLVAGQVLPHLCNRAAAGTARAVPRAQQLSLVSVTPTSCSIQLPILCSAILKNSLIAGIFHTKRYLHQSKQVLSFWCAKEHVQTVPLVCALVSLKPFCGFPASCISTQRRSTWRRSALTR